MPFAALPLLLLFACTLFVSATLLFLVQPMIGKMLLPMLGGTPAVWNTCMVFFQVMLLAGYAYAHATTAWLGVRRQAILHVGVLLLPFLTLGLTADRALVDYGEGSPIPGLLWVLLLTAGLPFFVVSTSAPLLQKWFAGTGHQAADDPYFLYGASNLGSMLALFGYPLLVEPQLTLAQQRLLWQVGYGVLAALTAVCAACVWRARAAVSVAGVKEEEQSNHTSKPTGGAPWAPLTPWQRLRWVALAFVPSSLMLGATTYITTDIAAIPLLWVLPLGFYLLSFILVFSRLPAWVHGAMVALLPFAVLPLVFLMLAEIPVPIWGKILVHLGVLFVVAMVCHGELARDRPPARYLTEFYLWMSVGGMLGGLFNALAAPLLFLGVAEYPVALVLACLLMPAEKQDKARPGLVLNSLFMGFLLGAGVALLIPALGRRDLDFSGLIGDGLWLAAAVAVAAALVGAAALTDRRTPGAGPPTPSSARWLDFGLPAALGVLMIGLTLGLRIAAVVHGLELPFYHFLEFFWQRLPSRVLFLLHPATGGPLILYGTVLPVVLCTFFINRPLRFGLAVGALLLASTFCERLNGDVRFRGRSFFGALQVSDESHPFRRLYHGTTLHGQQRLRWDGDTRAACVLAAFAGPDPLSTAVLAVAGRDVDQHPEREPLTYFHRTGPIGQVFAANREQMANRHVGLIGLGSGSLATYGQPGQQLTYFEIDPLVKRIAYDPEYFRFIRDALDRGVRVDVVLGDARLKLEERARGGPPDRFGLLVVDAFSSDAIPIHLITRQAFDIYLANLADDGLLAFHISNRYLDLEPVLGNLAKDLGLCGYIQTDWENGIAGKTSSTWVILAKDARALVRLPHEGRGEAWKATHGATPAEDALLALAGLPDLSGTVPSQAAAWRLLLERPPAPWRTLKTRPDMPVWTDDYSNLLRVFSWKD